MWHFSKDSDQIHLGGIHQQGSTLHLDMWHFSKDTDQFNIRGIHPQAST